MKEYKFSERNAKRAAKAQVLSLAPVYIVSVSAGLYIANSKSNGEVFENSLVLLIVFPVLAIALFFGVRLSIKIGTKALLLNKYQLSETSILRVSPIGKTLRIDIDKIDLHKSTKKGLLIKGQKQSLLIPEGVDDFAELSGQIIMRLE